MTVILVDDDGRVARHLAVALGAHMATLRRNGVPIPSSIEALRAQCAAYVGQTRPQLAQDPPAPDAEPMAVSYEQVGAALDLSVRSVRRLVAAGELEAVTIGGARRIRLEDLRAYVAGLSSHHSEQGGTRGLS